MRIKPTIKAVSGKIDVVPLIDVVFLLLIFFLISSSLVFQPGIAVELPKARGNNMRAAEKIIVTITRNNLLFFNDTPVEWAELERQLRELVLTSRTVMHRQSGSPDGGRLQDYSPMIVLRADAAVPYRRIAEVMALARSLGLGVYLATDIQK